MVGRARPVPAHTEDSGLQPDSLHPKLLEVSGLSVTFGRGANVVHAVNGVDFDIRAGETVCVVGESGSGKSAIALSLMRLLREPIGRISSGSIRYNGLDLATLPERAMRKIRAKEIAMIFQEPMSALNPVFTIGEQIAETLRLHERMNAKDARDRSIEILRLVQMPSPEKRAGEYPHQLSGGMRQRAMIAIAISCNPKLLIADEPTTALDVTVQAQILDLLGELKSRLSMAVLHITHDIGVVAETAQRVIVTYCSRIVEEAPVAELFSNPRHPYTQGLMRSVPRIDRETDDRPRLTQIPGTVPVLRGSVPPGCLFATRCASAKPSHFEITPELREVAPGHKVSCLLYD